MAEMGSKFDSTKDKNTQKAWKGKGRLIEGPEEGARLDKGPF